MRRHLNATPRTSIQAALSSPYYYLQVRLLRLVCATPLTVRTESDFFIFFKNERLKSEDGIVSNAAPDICIAYKLHLECGRLINLYDWLEVSL